MSIRFKVTGYIELEKAELEDAGDDPINALPEEVQLNLEEIEMIQVTEEGDDVPEGDPKPA